MDEEAMRSRLIHHILRNTKWELEGLPVSSGQKETEARQFIISSLAKLDLPVFKVPSTKEDLEAANKIVAENVIFQIRFVKDMRGYSFANCSFVMKDKAFTPSDTVIPIPFVVGKEELKKKLDVYEFDRKYYVHKQIASVHIG